MKKVSKKGNHKTTSCKKILLIVLSFLAIIVISVQLYRYLGTTETKKYIPPVEQKTIALFVPEYYGKLSQKTVPVQNYSSELKKADIIIEELKKTGHVPEKLVLLDFAIDENGMLYVNFSKDIKNSSRTEQEIMTVYSIINSLLVNFKNANKVLLLAEGQPLYTPGGLLYTYAPLGFNQGLLED
ncbi:MAG TPA: hypothetical protein DDW17_07630 [Deltaproteobacteria bacterium]|nr:hypothetical protein [Deltaproteobacteria bacterium]